MIFLRDYSVQNLLDHLCKVTQMIFSHMYIIVLLLLDKFKVSSLSIKESDFFFINLKSNLNFIKSWKHPDKIVSQSFKFDLLHDG